MFFMRKDSKLNAIREDAQRVAEAISSSLELETYGRGGIL